MGVSQASMSSRSASRLGGRSAGNLLNAPHYRYSISSGSGPQDTAPGSLDFEDCGMACRYSGGEAAGGVGSHFTR